jgi:hypothetical protein
MKNDFILKVHEAEREITDLLNEKSVNFDLAKTIAHGELKKRNIPWEAKVGVSIRDGKPFYALKINARF